MCRWQARIAKQAVDLVGKEEEDDLYFEGGQHSQEFVKLVVSLFTNACTSHSWHNTLKAVLLHTVLKTLSQDTPAHALTSLIASLAQAVGCASHDAVKARGRSHGLLVLAAQMSWQHALLLRCSTRWHHGIPSEPAGPFHVAAFLGPDSIAHQALS